MTAPAAWAVRLLVLAALVLAALGHATPARAQPAAGAAGFDHNVHARDVDVAGQLRVRPSDDAQPHDG